MVDARRGAATKERILGAACLVFAERGFRETTHAAIARRARVKTAAVSYYFISKEVLYQRVFEHVAELAESFYPLHGGLPKHAAGERRLCTLIHNQLCRMFDRHHVGALHRIRMAEMYDPTGLLEQALEEDLARMRGLIREILQGLLGPAASRTTLNWCELSVVGQILMAGPGPGQDRRAELLEIRDADLEPLAKHICSFTLGGLEAIRRTDLAQDSRGTPRQNDASAVQS